MLLGDEMKKLIVLGIIVFALCITVLADDWYSECVEDCPSSTVYTIARNNNIPQEDVECCIVCRTSETIGNWCGAKWRRKPTFVSPIVSPLVSPIKVLDFDVTENTPVKIQTPEIQEMPDWYYREWGFPCEYLNPGHTEGCTCFSNAPMWCD